MQNPSPAEYSLTASSTALYPQEHRLTYPVLGLVDELGEAMEKLHTATDKEFVKECGDVLWYINAACVEYGLKLEEDVVKEWEHVEPLQRGIHYWDNCKDRAIQEVCQICGMVKKHVRDKPLDKMKLATKLYTILECLVTFLEPRNISLGHVARVNNVKLLGRQERGTLQGSGDNR